MDGHTFEELLNYVTTDSNGRPLVGGAYEPLPLDKGWY